MGTFWAATEADEEEKEADAKLKDEEEEEEEEEDEGQARRQLASGSPLKGNGCCRERGRSLARDGVDEEGLGLG